MSQNENPGLKPYDLSQYKGLHNKNFYKMDTALQRMVFRYTESLSLENKKAIEDHLSGYGELVGGILNDLTEQSHKEGKYGEIQKYDRVGNRIDEVVYCIEQKESRRISYEYGVVNLDFHENWIFDFLPVHRYALAYLMNLNGEGGVSCPLAMTDGMIFALKNLGTEEQKEKYLPLVAGEKSSSHFMAGQYVTERVGGSNVGANRTVARKTPEGKWILNGEKWFCSNPGDLWVTTARIEDSNTIGMFLVSRFKSDGTLNGHHLLRKKDIIGSRGKVTAEIIYQDLEAEEFGRPMHGLVNLIKYIIKISRIHVGIGATGNSRRAVMEALEYSRFRKAYGKGLAEYAIYAKTLCELQIMQTALTFSNFQSIQFWHGEKPIQEITIPLLKYKSSSLAAEISHKAILCLGGNGIIGDFSFLPRILNDSIINESWEGTHFLLTDHILHALERKKIRESFFEYLDAQTIAMEKFPVLEKVKKYFEDQRKVLESLLLETSKEFREINRIYIADFTYNLYSLSVLSSEAVFDLNRNVQDSIYVLFTEVYKEILEIGTEGLLPTDALLNRVDLRDRILNY